MATLIKAETSVDVLQRTKNKIAAYAQAIEADEWEVVEALVDNYLDKLMSEVEKGWGCSWSKFMEIYKEL